MRPVALLLPLLCSACDPQTLECVNTGMAVQAHTDSDGASHLLYAAKTADYSAELRTVTLPDGPVSTLAITGCAPRAALGRRLNGEAVLLHSSGNRVFLHDSLEQDASAEHATRESVHRLAVGELVTGGRIGVVEVGGRVSVVQFDTNSSADLGPGTVGHHSLVRDNAGQTWLFYVDDVGSLIRLSVDAFLASGTAGEVIATSDDVAPAATLVDDEQIAVAYVRDRRGRILLITSSGIVSESGIDVEESVRKVDIDSRNHGIIAAFQRHASTVQLDVWQMAGSGWNVRTIPHGYYEFALTASSATEGYLAAYSGNAIGLELYSISASGIVELPTP